MGSLLTRIEKGFSFSRKELSQMLITVIVASFILNFRSWGGDEFSLEAGLVNLFVTLIIVFASFFIHFSAQKIIGLSLGYTSRYKYWLNGLIISLIICFFTYGYFPLFFTGSLWHEINSKLRVGIHRGGVRHRDLGYIALAGPIASIILVGLAAPLYMATDGSFIYTFIVANLLIAVFSMLPIPHFEKIRQFKGGTTGLYLFIASRWNWVLTFASLLAFTGLILVFKIFSYILALLIGIIITIVYYHSYET